MEMQRNDKDCLQCCLSTLLNINYEKIPKFYEMYDEDLVSYNYEYNKWLDSLGYFRISIDSKLGEDNTINCRLPKRLNLYFIGIFKSPDKTYSHAVIVEYKNGEFLGHDPQKDSGYEWKHLIEFEFIIKKNSLIETI